MDTNAFPDIRWGHDRRLLKKPLNAFVSSRIGSWYLRKLTPIDRKLLAHSKGRRTIFGPMGVPLLLLTTTGRKTGQPRTTPLTYMRKGDRLFLVGSNFGRPHHPAWSENLLANREATVTIGGAEIPVNNLVDRAGGGERLRTVRRIQPYVLGVQDSHCTKSSCVRSRTAPNLIPRNKNNPLLPIDRYRLNRPGESGDFDVPQVLWSRHYLLQATG